jgi:ubiquinone/menaquinone biosynthesis C-methylase UbiE
MAKENIQAFWGDLYQQLYASNDASLSPDLLEKQIDALEDLFRIREQSCVVEMPRRELAGKKVLEIGSGAGGHSCIFKRHGADVTAVDITPERVASTAAKFAMLKGGSGNALQADAENLPFDDESFDIVYSNGVLHHSPDTERCIAEATRVLKPGGLVVIMLYSRVSAAFMFNIWPRGIVTGEMFRWPEAEWVGRLTEGKPVYGDTRNPITRVYSRRQITELFGQFDIVSLRKWSFQFDNFCVPRLTQIRRWVLTRLGFGLHPGGTIVYGQPIVPETAIERWLSSYLGFGWTVKAVKPAATDEPGGDKNAE